MAAVDYKGIRDSLESILTGDSRVNGYRIFVEEEPQFGLQDAERAIVVYLDRRAARGPDQVASAGKRTRWELRVTFWVFAFSLESYRKACGLRDDLTAQLELVLMENRTISGKVAHSYLEGGAFVSAREATSGAFMAAGETALVAEVSAVTT